MNQETQKKSNIEHYDKLSKELITSNAMSTECQDIVEKCKIGLKKIRLAKQFSKIDEDLVELSSKKAFDDGFFSGILSLEAKRLAFKEEAIKCQDQATHKKINS